MFQSPLGGVALLINALIVTISAVSNKLNGKHIHTPVISQLHIDKMHAHRVGKHINLTLNYLIPAFVFALVLTVSSYAFLYFYNDENKFTVIDAAKYGANMSMMGYDILANNISPINTSTINNTDPELNFVGLYLGNEGYSKTEQQALILQDRITAAALDNFPLLSNILIRR